MILTLGRTDQIIITKSLIEYTKFTIIDFNSVFIRILSLTLGFPHPTTLNGRTGISAHYTYVPVGRNEGKRRATTTSFSTFFLWYEDLVI